MKSKSCDPVQATLAFDGADPMPIPNPAGDSRADALMPYEQAAKAIYVRANGIPAYHRATGHIRRLGDAGKHEPI